MPTVSPFGTQSTIEAEERGERVSAPADFVDDVEHARREGRHGDLRLFATEVRGFEWEQEGLRLTGEARLKLRALEESAGAPAQVILFTGHMVDAPGKPKVEARFPPTAGAEARARALIEAAVQKEARGQAGITLGIAGGACGGDILFHEICDRLGVPTHLYLALPQDRFEAVSVQRAGANWVLRYKTLCRRLDARVLQATEALPCWLAGKPDYDVWQRNNLWMLFNALATGSRQLTLIALFNAEREPDGPGGTRHLIEEARKWGFESIELDARELLVG